MSDELLLVRHGQSHSNAASIVEGPGCGGLTEGGHVTARAVAVRLAAERKISALHTSSTRRARETASAITAATGIRAVSESALRVPDPGAREGLPWSQVRAEGVLPDETWEAYLDRVHCRLELLVAQHPGGRVVVVGHAETASALFVLFTRCRDLGGLRVPLDYGAITSFIRFGGYWQLHRHNDTMHVPPGAPRYPAAISSSVN